MYNDIDIEDKVKYLKEIGENILTKADLDEYIIESLQSTGDFDYRDYNDALSEDEINDIFEEKIETIIEKTDIKDDYPGIFEKQENTISMKL